MPRNHYVLIGFIFLYALFIPSCSTFQFVWDAEVMKHMKTVLTEPNETVISVVDEWNTGPDVRQHTFVDLEFIKKNIISIDFNIEEGCCEVHYQTWLDMEDQRRLVGQCMIIYGGLYWRHSFLMKDIIYLNGYFDDIETLVFSWERCHMQPIIDSDRLQDFI